MVKGGAAVDPDSGLEHRAHVLTRGSKDIYSVVLGLVDIVRGTNSFYKLQLLAADSKDRLSFKLECPSSHGVCCTDISTACCGRYWVFRAWGRVGTSIGGNKLEECDSLLDAEMEFKRLYEEKTGNMWADRHNFVKYPNRFYPLDLDYGPNEDEVQPVLRAGHKSKLELAVQNLICLIFDVETMKKAMLEFEIDLKKMPLGKLSKKQIEAAYKVLSELQEEFGYVWLCPSISQSLWQMVKKEEETSETRLVDAANRFYTLIPHDFGLRKPPLIRSPEVIKAKIDMLDSLLEIELAYKMLKETPDGKMDPIDQHYLQLRADISVADCPEMDMIQKYVANTHAATHSSYSLHIQDVFKVSRHTETKRFKPFLKLPNHKLLWHGSRITNFAGILSQGLRIAPPEAPSTGYMFGKGLYFADMVSKSANYCCTSPSNPYGLLMLCRVALGSMYELKAANYIEKLPAAKHSTKGLGKTVPDPSMAITLESGVEVPLGTGIEADVGRSSLLYNEYPFLSHHNLVKLVFTLKPLT
ncbi:PARP1 [Cordylochernes scorpioides]|uniref:Poly [ADP-ribose] polymerase n=1 Tax=Cordylochernes scorpioides TaxID=51811 RepID=A0ABY6LGX0_9ARAC|nr:PARP1 [Cordylochernes scorpioides]